MEMLPGTEISLSCRLNIAYLLLLIHLVLLLFMYSRKTELTSEIQHYFPASFHASGSHSTVRSFQHHSFHLLQTHVSLIGFVNFQLIVLSNCQLFTVYLQNQLPFHKKTEHQCTAISTNNHIKQT